MDYLELLSYVYAFLSLLSYAFRLNKSYYHSATDLSFSAPVPVVPETTTVHTPGKRVRIKQ